ncbi:MAG: hypothetical protein CSA94_02470 [Bacteroidetes bacterium]|nr:MAG: hypothetical protein CSA94_02470 [Bacteroidota bacterium]
MKNLTVSYTKSVKIIDNLNLSLAEGVIHGIVGLNGAGKTTLLNTIYGLKKQDDGSITFKGKKLNKQEISYLVTENFFYSNITAREYLSLFQNKDFDLEKWNALFGLPLDKIIDGYSTGMKKKLVILGVFKQDKPILILDEPFNGLDIETVRILRSILLKLKEKGKTIIVTSHIMETLTNLCDYIHYLDKGKIGNSCGKEEFGKFEQEIFSKIALKNEVVINEVVKGISNL